MNSNVIYRCLLSGLLAAEVGSGCIPSDELMLPGRLEPDDSLDEEVLGVGTWGDVTYDASRRSLVAFANSKGAVASSVEKIAGAYPNLERLELSCRDLEVGEDLVFDCLQLSSLHHLECLNLFVCGRVENLDVLLDNPRPKSFFLGVHRTVPMEDAGPMPARCLGAEKDCFSDSASASACLLQFEETGHLFCKGVLRSAVLQNPQRTLVALKQLPPDCNAVDLNGCFDLSALKVCEHLEQLSWSCDDADSTLYSGWITADRFPNLKYLVLRWTSQHVCDQDFRTLIALPMLKAARLELDNIKPRGIDVSVQSANRPAIHLIVHLDKSFQDGVAGNGAAMAE